MERDTILILDFGGQYKQLIARRVRECQVYCEILPYTTALEELKSRDPKGIILTGGPSSVYDPASPTCDSALFSLGVPVLGICYGSQLMAHLLGGRVQPASHGLLDEPYGPDHRPSRRVPGDGPHGGLPRGRHGGR